MVSKTETQTKSGVAHNFTDKDMEDIKALAAWIKGDGKQFVSFALLTNLNPTRGVFSWTELLKNANECGLIHSLRFGCELEVRS